MDDLDHRNLGVKLKLWHLQEDAPGMVFWHPRGYAVYRVLEDYAHVFCCEQDVEGEVACFIALLGEAYRDLGFPDYQVALATRPAARAGDDASWDWSEAKLGDAARQCGLVPQINPGEGAFYGPKLEFALRDRLGRSWQGGTVQLDGGRPRRLG